MNPEIPIAPRVTALVITRNNAAALRRCLASLEASANRSTIEIIVVDNGSQDETAQVAAEFPKVDLLYLPKNFGLTKALNIGIRTAKGDYVFLMNPGVEVEPDTLSKLADRMAGDPKIGAVCPYLEKTYALPTPEALALYCRTGEFSGAKTIDPDTPEVAVDFPWGFPMMVRRAFLVGMNYFDERFGQFGPLMELCFQIRGANKSILMLPGVRVQRAPIREEDDASYAADRVHGAATYISKHFGSGPAIGFRMKAIFSALARIFTFRDVGYDFQRLTGLLGGQKIDGNQ